MTLVELSLPNLQKISQLAASRKARAPIVLDMRKISAETDWWFICSGTSTRHVQGICDHIVQQLKTTNTKPLGVEGYEEGNWVLIDYNEIIIHIFLADQRKVYALESLHPKQTMIEPNSLKTKLT